MKIIVAVDKNWGIGFQNKLLISIPEDMRFFRNKTMNKVVIMGKNTLDTFPGGNALKNRVNIVITRNENCVRTDAIVVHSIEEAMEEVNKYKAEDIYVIGGASIYKQFLPFCDTAFVTKIEYAYQADTFFPDLDEDEDWYITEESEKFVYCDTEYTFYKYERKK
jgi:dihydrofolate reductase